MLNPKSGVPLYQQLQDALASRIGNGEWASGALFPSDKELEAEFKVSRITVRRALQELQRAGVIRRFPGRGTFVSEPKVAHQPGGRDALGTALDRLGRKAEWTLISAGVVEAPAHAVESLGVSPNARLFRLVRLRLVDGEPIGHLESFVAPRVPVSADEASLVGGDSLAYLDASGSLKGAQAIRTLEATAASNDLSHVLGIEPGAPILRIHRTVTTADGDPLEVLTAQYRGDRFQYALSAQEVDSP